MRGYLNCMGVFRRVSGFKPHKLMCSCHWSLKCIKIIETPESRNSHQKKYFSGYVSAGLQKLLRSVRRMKGDRDNSKLKTVCKFHFSTKANTNPWNSGWYKLQNHKHVQIFSYTLCRKRLHTRLWLSVKESARDNPSVLGPDFVLQRLICNCDKWALSFSYS